MQGGADSVLNFSKGNDIKYVEALDVIGYYENGYKVKSTYTIYDPYNIGYQKLMNGNGYFSTGWHLSIYVDTSKASRYTMNGTINYKDNIIGLAFIFK